LIVGLTTKYPIVITLDPADMVVEEDENPVAQAGNNFLNTYLNLLPHHAGTAAKYGRAPYKRRYWLALILSFGDRYSHGDVIAKKKFNVPEDVQVASGADETR
jgi:hypothetical protein